MNTTTSVMSEESNMLRAKAWAQNVVDMPEWKVQEVDKPSLMSVLVTAITMENPLPDPTFNLDQSPHHYTMRLTGFKQRHKMRVWYNMFLNEELRDPTLESVLDVDWQTSASDDGIILIFIVKKHTFQTAQKRVRPVASSAGNGSASTRRFKKRY